MDIEASEGNVISSFLDDGMLVGFAFKASLSGTIANGTMKMKQFGETCFPELPASSATLPSHLWGRSRAIDVFHADPAV